MCPSKDRTDTETQSLEVEVQGFAQNGFEANLVAGCYGDKGKINGKVTIPSHCSKIAVILRDGKNDKQRINCDTRVIAVDMPNERRS
jgi:endonuclease G, mitochondrial